MSVSHADLCCQAVVLLDGTPVTDFSFANGIFRTTSPIAWTTPNGETTQVCARPCASPCPAVSTLPDRT
jgi:hypothetical protein